MVVCEYKLNNSFQIPGIVAAGFSRFETMEEISGECCGSPLFGDTTTSHYYIRCADRTVTCKTRQINRVSISDDESCELFADNLWPGSFVLADFLCDNTFLCNDKNVLELGAGSSLPSLVAAVLGANKVVVTDYPEDSVIENITQVFNKNKICNHIVLPHRWGDSVESLVTCIPSDRKFDLLLLAELLWKDTYQLHDLLLQSISQSIDEDNGVGIMTFVHRPTEVHKPAHDMEFFELGKEKYGLQYKYLGSSTKYYDVFEEDHIPAVVNVYILYFSSNAALENLDFKL